MTLLALLALLCAAGPAVMFVLNLRVFTCPTDSDSTPTSILIPARDEEVNIASAVTAALENANSEVLVLDDGSSDRTAEIVRAIAARDQRVLVLAGKPLPDGWCGKNFACAQLAAAATHRILLFVDADVRLASDGVGRMVSALKSAKADLISGIPRQEVRTFSETLLVPMIPWVLLGFLPLERMRQSRHPAYATGCGQLMMTEAGGYLTSGGHAAIRNQIHDGLALPKLFRRAGFRTDLLDATKLATCRMYRTNADVWRGLLKNTHEGLGAPARIVPLSLILLAGQVLPFLLFFWWKQLSSANDLIVLLAAALSLLPRFLALRRFQQPTTSACLHPVGALALVAIQWIGLCRLLLRRPAKWRGREYGAGASGSPPK